MWLTDFSRDSTHALAYARTLAELSPTRSSPAYVIDNPASSLFAHSRAGFLFDRLEERIQRDQIGGELGREGAGVGVDLRGNLLGRADLGVMLFFFRIGTLPYKGLSLMQCLLGRTLVFILAMVSLPCWAQTQTAVTEAACQRYQRVDKELNQTYRAVLARYAAEPLFLTALQQAQRAWLTFRDLHLEARFPEKDKRRSYGSVYSSCRCAELTALTQARVNQLRCWLEGTEEGDVCSGSIRQRGDK